MSSPIDQELTQEQLIAQKQFHQALVLVRRMLRPVGTLAISEAETPEQDLLENICAYAVYVLSEGSSCVDITTFDGDNYKELGLPSFDTTSVRETLKANPQACYVGAAATFTDNQIIPFNLDGDLLYLAKYAVMEVTTALRLDHLQSEAVLPRLIAQQSDAIIKVIQEAELLSMQTSNGKAFLSPAQARALVVAPTHGFMVLTGGPGTGKTTTVVRILETLRQLWQQFQPNGSVEPIIHVAAPTGKAADRLSNSIAQNISSDWSQEAKDFFSDIKATTIHKLLGRAYSNLERYSHSAQNPLTGDIFVVDEASMLSLEQLARLVQSIPHGAQLILVGDQDQLASVEVGTILADIVGGYYVKEATETAHTQITYLDEKLSSLAAYLQADAAHQEPWPTEGLSQCANGLCQLSTAHRFNDDAVGSFVRGIQHLSRKTKTDDLEARAAQLLERFSQNAAASVQIIDTPSMDALNTTFLEIEAAISQLPQAADLTTVEEARAEAIIAEQLDAIDNIRLLCANRSGKNGAEAYNQLVARHLAAAESSASATLINPFGERNGAPLMVTHNNKALNVSNGDTGILVYFRQSWRVYFKGSLAQGDPQASLTHTPVRFVNRFQLEDAQVAYALTIHKSQGSEYLHAMVIMAEDENSPLNTRELLYTGVSRGKKQVTLVGKKSVLLRALTTQVSRASGLLQRITGSRE